MRADGSQRMSVVAVWRGRSGPLICGGTAMCWMTEPEPPASVRSQRTSSHRRCQVAGRGRALMTRVVRHRAVAGRARQMTGARTYLVVSTNVSKARQGLDQLT